MQVFDFAGQRVYYPTHSFFLGSANAGVFTKYEAWTNTDCSGSASSTRFTDLGKCSAAKQKVTGTCAAAIYTTYTDAACTAGATAAAAINLGTTMPGTCLTAAGVSAKTICTASAGAMASPGAWSMVVAAASMIAVMKQ